MIIVREAPASSQSALALDPAQQRRAWGSASHYRRQVILTSGLLLVGDVIVLAGALAVASAVLYSFGPLNVLSPGIAAWTAGAVLFTLALLKLYNAPSVHPVLELRGTALAGCIGGAVFLFHSCVAYPLSYGLSSVALWLLLLIGLPVGRALTRSFGSTQSWWGIKTLVIGDGGAPAAVYGEMRRDARRGIRPVGWLYRGEFLQTFSTESPAVTADGLAGSNFVVVPPEGTPGVVAALDEQESDEAQLLLRALCQAFVQTTVLCPHWQDLPSLEANSLDVANAPGLCLKNRLLDPIAMNFKRVFDVTLALLFGIAALPLALVIVLLIKLTSRGPAFYSQERIGQHGLRFQAWKFRTMVVNADEILPRFFAEHPELEAEWHRDHKIKNDPRITRIGQFLRKSSLDELPQLLNILRGEMSLVGPRPIVAAEVEKYGQEYADYLQVLPGVTGMWQISGRNDTSYPQRVALDAYYVRNWSVWLDLYILVRTIKTVICREGAY